MVSLVLGVLLLAGMSAGDLVELHKPTMIPEGWRATEEQVDGAETVRVTVGLKRSNLDVLERLVKAVSDPRGADYLQYPSYEKVGDLVRPKATHTATVMRWLRKGGVRVTSVHPHGDYVHGEATVEQLEHMANGRFAVYRHVNGARTVKLSSAVRVPRDVAESVAVFSGFHTFPLVARAGVARNVTGAGAVNPTVCRSTYGITSVGKSGKQNIQAVGQFQGQFTNDEDLASFCEKFNAGTTCKIAKYVGENKQKPVGLESMLDTEYIMSLGDLTPTWVYSFPASDFCEDLLAFGSNVTGEATYPYTISISYGSQKIGFCKAEQVSRFSEDVQKMSAMGITVVIASGDDGSGGWTRDGFNLGKLSPAFPASVPYATAVGATYFMSGTSGEEQATTLFGSGGGFSYDFPAPDYQKESVGQYMETVTKPDADYSTNGRGSPDVAFLGQGFTLLAAGQVVSLWGTSASAPSFAAVVSLLNEACLAESGKPLGFVNPLFYQNPSMFTDITNGTNAIGFNCDAGWGCTKGWDAVTGLGTPDFPKMLSVVKAACAKAAKRH